METNEMPRFYKFKWYSRLNCLLWPHRVHRENFTNNLYEAFTKG